MFDDSPNRHRPAENVRRLDLIDAGFLEERQTGAFFLRLANADELLFMDFGMVVFAFMSLYGLLALHCSCHHERYVLMLSMLFSCMLTKDMNLCVWEEFR